MNTETVPASKYLRRQQVLARYGIANSTLYYLIKAGKLPAPTKLGERVSLWSEADLDAYDAERESA